MKDKPHDEAMADLYRERPAEAFAMFRALLLDAGQPGITAPPRRGFLFCPGRDLAMYARCLIYPAQKLSHDEETQGCEDYCRIG